MQTSNMVKTQGFTLVELMVAMSIFVIALTIGTGVFIQGLRSQRFLTGEMALNNNMNLVLEQMARDIRTGHSFIVSSVGDKHQILFIGRDGSKIQYNFAPSSINKTVNGVGPVTITSENVDVVEGKFILHERGNCDPWRITVQMGVRSLGSKKELARIQTTVSSRILPEDTGEEKYRVCEI